jgi:isoamylase
MTTFKSTNNKRAMTFLTKPGYPSPFGTLITPNGVNFAVFANCSREVNLILRNPETLEIFAKIPLNFQTGQVKHCFVESLAPPFLYSFEVDGKELLDPFAKALSSPHEWGKDEKYQPYGLTPKEGIFDWSEDHRLNLPKEDLIIYEMHVRGFTQDPSSQVFHPGTFLGVIEKIPYLLDLGVNAVELIPIHEFNENEYRLNNPQVSEQLYQYWGYSTVNFFCPMNRYAIGDAASEFKQMVLALHKGGIEVILDVVFNHTSEGNEHGPIQSFKGLSNKTYYIFDSNDQYANYTGCGNTFNCNHPAVISFIIEALQYWVVEMHVDGFRFDLASIFYRGEDGHVLTFPPILEAITKDPILAGVKLIAEPWDASGLYQVGGFFPESKRFGEWNGRYRDCMRRFLKGDTHLKGEFATRLSGSEDLYGHDRRAPKNSINFITCHDGFTLSDLVSYNSKHNLANGEYNRDGTNQNDSWNCGQEGKSDDLEVLLLRMRQMKNIHLALMVSQGVPMLNMGDEYGHTKEGNNNTWCQDNRLNWFLWDKLQENGPLFRFYKGLIHFRRSNPLLCRKKFLQDDDIEWHGKVPCDPLWDIDDQFVAFTLIDKVKGNDLYIAFNASKDQVEIRLPKARSGKSWARVANTALASPEDYVEDPREALLHSTSCSMASCSSLILILT